jgi:competence protein ComFC
MSEYPSNISPSSKHHKARVSPGFFMSQNILKNILQIGVDLLFPPRCGGCGRVDTFWCDSCQDKLNQISYPERVRPLPPLADIASTALHMGIIREAVQALKYENAQPVAIPLGERLAHQLSIQNWIFDIVVPVPLHTSRLAERGYNQSQLLGEQVAKHMAIPCSPAALHRERHTQSQVTMSAAARLTNVQNAFSADFNLIQSRTILLIDDVYTTGATLRACAEALLANGAAAVYGLTVTVAHI